MLRECDFTWLTNLGVTRSLTTAHKLIYKGDNNITITVNLINKG